MFILDMCRKDEKLNNNANDIIGSFPADQVPEKTAGYDGSII